MNIKHIVEKLTHVHQWSSQEVHKHEPRKLGTLTNTRNNFVIFNIQMFIKFHLIDLSGLILTLIIVVSLKRNNSKKQTRLVFLQVFVEGVLQMCPMVSFSGACLVRSANSSSKDTFGQLGKLWNSTFVNWPLIIKIIAYIFIFRHSVCVSSFVS